MDLALGVTELDSARGILKPQTTPLMRTQGDALVWDLRIIVTVGVHLCGQVKANRDAAPTIPGEVLPEPEVQKLTHARKLLSASGKPNTSTGGKEAQNVVVDEPRLT